MTPKEYAEKAASLIGGERARTHGDYELQHRVLAELWAVYLKYMPGELNALHAAQMMVLLKISRTLAGEPAEDHYVDQIGYAALAGAIHDAQRADPGLPYWPPIGLDGQPLPGWYFDEVNNAYLRIPGETSIKGDSC